MATTAGCSSIANSDGSGGGSDDGSDDGGVTLGDNSTGTTGAQTLRIPVEESVAGQSLSSVSARYPRDRFVVDGTSHDAITIGVDQSGDGTLEEEFAPGAISGANNNEYSFTVTLETDYELTTDDIVVLEYPAVANPDEPGEYGVSVTLNDEQETNVSITVE